MPDDKEALSHWRMVQSKLSKLFVHDLKNPISALSANLSFLESAMAVESSEIRGAVKDSILAAEMLLRFSDNFNYIAMLESGEKCAVSEIEIDTFLRVISRRIKKFADSAGVVLVVEEAPKNVFVAWQHRYAELVLENLIISALRHSPQGGVVRVSLSVEENQVRFSVTDQGKPVEEEFAPSLFTRDTQADAKKNPECRYGRGLGLYAAGLAAKALGGRVEAGAKDGLAKFVFQAPLTTAE
jgi:signal transduction histidine kinase